jgi:hypothetical protein
MRRQARPRLGSAHRGAIWRRVGWWSRARARSRLSLTVQQNGSRPVMSRYAGGPRELSPLNDGSAPPPPVRDGTTSAVASGRPRTWSSRSLHRAPSRRSADSAPDGPQSSSCVETVACGLLSGSEPQCSPRSHLRSIHTRPQFPRTETRAGGRVPHPASQRRTSRRPGRRVVACCSPWPRGRRRCRRSRPGR